MMKNARKKGTLLFLAFQLALYVQGQPLVSGSVADEQSGEPLIGASIIVKGSGEGAITDVYGNYSLKATPSSVLVFSYVGYRRQEITVESQGTIDVRLRAGFDLQEVKVTARRRVEGIQETPIAITALQGKSLEEMGVEDLSGLGNIAPNLSFSTAGTVSGSPSSAVVYIRGVGQNDYTPVTDPGVGIYVDDVYLGRTIGSVLDLLDLKRVEVIRGPQGTLFGRNTIGGAISLHTNEPAGEFTGKVKFVGGSYARNELFATLSGPLNDNLSASLNLMRRNREGYVERVNVPGARALGNDNAHGARFQLKYTPDDNLSFRLSADYVIEREESAPEQNLYFWDTRPLPAGWNQDQWTPNTDTPDIPDLPASTATGYVPGDTKAGTDIYDQRWNYGPFKTGETALSQNDIDTWGLSLASDYVVNETTKAKLILAYRGFQANFARQVDGSPLNVFENREYYAQNQFSADLRLNGNLSKLDYVAGAFYFVENMDDQLDFTGALEGIAYPIHLGGLVKNANYAAYGESTIHLTEKFDLSTGLRFTREFKRANPNDFSYPQGDIDNPPSGPRPIRSDENTTRLIDQIWQENSFEQITWRVNAAYKASEAVNVYGTVSTGFKSGGFEWRITNTSFYGDPSNDYDGDGDGDLPQFAPEDVTSYELGVKTDLPNSDFRLNLAAFFTAYNNIQIAANPPGGIATFQTNAGQGEIKGFEAELIWVPNRALLVNAGLGYTDARFTKITGVSPISLDDQFILTPEWSAAWGASYRASLPNGGLLTPRIDGHYKSEVQFEAENSAYVFDDGHVALNASANYKTKGRRWGFTIGINNLTNELYIIGGDANTAIGYENGMYARPRNAWVSVEYMW